VVNIPVERPVVDQAAGGRAVNQVVEADVEEVGQSKQLAEARPGLLTDLLGERRGADIQGTQDFFSVAAISAPFNQALEHLPELDFPAAPFTIRGWCAGCALE
jgi:hypothetical protein